MSAALLARLAGWQPALDARLASCLPVSALGGSHALNDAIRYAVFPGGRRWRPALTLLGAMATGIRPEAVLDAACGVELVHSASLILDDLPAMDDGHERRGRPTLHRVYGEGVAVLAALALLNRGYELFLYPVPGAPSDSGSRLLLEATTAIGADGMIGGQAADLAGSPSLESRERKTTALVRLAAVAGAIAGGADDGDVRALSQYGECLGAAYQMHDDVLDVEGGGAPLKTLGQDARHGRGSWTACGGAGAARAAANARVEEARRVIETRFGNRPGAILLAEAAAAILELITGPLVPAHGQR